MHTAQGPGQPRGKGPASGHTDAGSTLVSTSPLSKSLGLTELMVFVIKLTRQVKKKHHLAARIRPAGAIVVKIRFRDALSVGWDVAGGRSVT